MALIVRDWPTVEKSVGAGQDSNAFPTVEKAVRGHNERDSAESTRLIRNNPLDGKKFDKTRPQK